MFGLPENNAHRFDVGVIGDVVKDVHYGTAKKAIDKGKYIYLRMNNITYDGELDLSDIKRIDVPDKDLPGCMVQRGDVLFNRTNSKDLVGKTCCFSDDEPMIIAGYIIRLRMNGKVLPEYLSVFMNLERSKKMLYSMAKGAVGQANINAKEVQSIEIVIPPMDIQNSFLTLSRQSDKSKFSCLKSQFIEMFGDPESVIDNAINTVADVADVQVGLVIKPTRFYSADGTGTPAFRSLNIGEMYIRDSEWIYFTDKGMVENQRTIAHTGDVLVVRSGYPGTSCVVTPEYDGRNVVDLIIAHPNVSKILPEFLCAFTNYPHGKIQIENSQRGVAQKHFNVSLYNKMKIVVPPMELQKQFVQLFHQSDKSK